jgi:hypothetical protein
LVQKREEEEEEEKGANQEKNFFSVYKNSDVVFIQKEKKAGRHVHQNYNYMIFRECIQGKT